MRFSYILASGLFALSTQAAAIQPEEVEKRAAVGVAAHIATDILHLVGLAVGVDVNIRFKREDVEKRADEEVVNALAADIVKLSGLESASDATNALAVDILRLSGLDATTAAAEKREEISVAKRGLVNVSSALCLNILQLIGLSIGVNVNVGKRDTVDVNSDEVVDVLKLIQSQLTAESAEKLKKRGIDISQLAQDLPIIASGVITAVDAIADGALAALV